MQIITLFIVLNTLLLGGCGSDPVKEEPKPPPETKIEVSITVSDKVNPDINNRASPIVMRLYELKNIGKFEEADFFKLFEDYEGALGGDLVASEKFHFKPGDIKTLGHTVSPDTKYIAVTASFRDFNQSVWRDSIAIEANKTNELEVVMERLALTIKKKQTK
jgi:type VI secretion system protein VasD